MQLTRSTLWRNALERDPHREGRLLYQQNPPENPDARSGPEAQRGPNAVDANRDTTRDRTHATMEGGGEPENLSAVNVEMEVNAAKDRVETTQKKMSDLESYARSHLDGESYELWKEHNIFLDHQFPRLQKAQEAAGVFAQFSSGQIHPSDLVRTMHGSLFQHERNDLQGLNQASEVIGRTVSAALARRSQEVGGRITWDTANVQTRQEIAREVLNTPEIQALLLTLQESAAMTTSAIDESNVDKVMKALDDKAKESAGQSGEALFGLSALGVELHTIGDILGGLSDAWEAISSAWARRRQLQRARVARMFGAAAKVLPFIGTDVDQSLQASLQGKEKEEQNKHFESLDQLKSGYTQVLEYMAANTNDYNRLQGAVRYAASRGWLYEFYRPNPPTVLLGVPISKICANMNDKDRANYVSTTQQNNEKGGRDEADGTKSRERQNNNLGQFKKALHNELNDLNLWGAVGVMQAALARGRAGETGTLMTTIFINEVRRNPQLRELVTAEMLDGMFSWALPEAPYMLSRLQGERNAGLADWIADGAKDGAMNRGGPLVGVIGTVDRILAPMGVDAKKKDEIISHVLAGKTVELPNGSHLSIFQSYPAFNKFRNAITTNDYKLPEVKGADDYFSVANGRSEIVYAPDSWIRYLVQIDSNGGLAYGTLAENLFIQFCNIHDELSKARLVDGLSNFRRETAEKIYNGLAGGQRKELATGYQSKYITVNGQKKSIADALRERNLLTPEAIRLIWPEEGGQQNQQNRRRAA